MSVDIEYSIKHHVRAKNLKIKVNGLGGVEVVAPKGIPIHVIDCFVEKHKDWIAKTKNKLNDYRLSHPDLGFLPPLNLKLPAINKTYVVQYFSETKKNTLVEQGNKLLVYSAHKEEQVILLRNWIQKTAKLILVPWLMDVSQLHKINFNKVTIRGQKTRWGSCSSQNNINLNRNLLFVAPELVNYLMIHELVHIIHPNHSSQYWQKVGTYESNYNQLDKQLNQSTKIIPLWACKYTRQ